MTNYIVYRFNDMSNQFIMALGAFFKTAFFPLENTLGQDKDFIAQTILNNLYLVAHPILVNNLLVILSVALAFIFAYLLGKEIYKVSFINITSALLYSISNFVVFRYMSFTPTLYFIFVFPLLLYLLIKKKNPYLIGFIVSLILATFNYYGFFLCVLIGIWKFYDLLFVPNGKKEAISYMAKIYVVPVFIILLLYFPNLKTNTPFLSDYKGEDTKTNLIYRPIQDWYNLSFRPWYFVIPPQSSLFFGDLSKSLYKQIFSTGYYLADDYMEEEMAGSYIGWHFILGTVVVGILLLLQKFKNKTYPIFKTVYENKEMILKSFFIILCILLISGPPTFTIGGFTIYTPTYILYYIVPVFRTLVRWAVVIYLFVLIINFYLVQDLYNFMKTKFHKALFIISFLLLNFVIFAIKIPVINLNNPPAEMTFLRDVSSEKFSYAVYPQGDYYSIFWILVHRKFLINPVDFVNKETGFISNEFSKNLITPEGISEFRKLNPKYFVYYEREVNPTSDKMEKLTNINPQIKIREDISRFFESQFGKPVFIHQSVYVYKSM